MNKDLSAHLTKKEEPIEETGVTTAEDVAVTAIAENEPQEKKEEGFLMNL